MVLLFSMSGLAFVWLPQEGEWPYVGQVVAAARDGMGMWSTLPCHRAFPRIGLALAPEREGAAAEVGKR